MYRLHSVDGAAAVYWRLIAAPFNSLDLYSHVLPLTQWEPGGNARTIYRLYKGSRINVSESRFSPSSVAAMADSLSLFYSRRLALNILIFRFPEQHPPAKKRQS